MYDLRRKMNARFRGNPAPNPQTTTSKPRSNPPSPPAPSETPQSNHIDIAAALATTTITSTKPTSPSTNSSHPHTPVDPSSPLSLHLARLPIPHPILLRDLLQSSNRVDTINQADAHRHSLVTALSNARDHNILAPLLDTYIPYALTLWDISQNLKAKGIYTPSDIVWTSSLNQHSMSSDTFASALGLEAAMVLFLSALIKLRQIIETDGHFATQSDQLLVSHIKSLQVAAGIFAYIRDTLNPAAIADFEGAPPPELFPDTASMFFSLSVCMAQTLHVRRAAISGMSVPLLAKLSRAANDLANETLVKYKACVTASISLTEDVKNVIDFLDRLSKGWVFQYVGLSTDVSTRAGVRVAALSTAYETLRHASQVPLIGVVATVDLEMISNELDEAVRANKIVYQDAVPVADDIPLPPGRPLGGAKEFEAKRIPADDKPPE
eukprot:GFKZ01014876.1.p1 GENE.GFKZ01014876.1~~GFKZ01014876.1.p1  ORF type:complete len:438 (-),score=68.47 GFKZ01014876.1:401-1714(-)